MSIKCVWTAPTKHTSGRPAKPGDLKGYDLQMRVEGAPGFTNIATPGPTETEFTIDVNDPGLYEFQLFAKSSNGKTSAAGSGSIRIEDDTPLAAPVLTVTLV